MLGGSEGDFFFVYCFLVLLLFDVLLHSQQIKQNQIIKRSLSQLQSLFLNDNARNVIFKIFIELFELLYFE